MKNKTIALAGAGIVAASALALGGAALASADETTGSSSVAANGSGYGLLGEWTGGAEGDRGNSNGNGNTDPTKPMRSDEKLLTGDTAAKVTAAARAKEPNATIERAETDSDGVYEAHMVRADGTHVIVQVDASFAVTAVQEGGQGGQRGQGAPAGDGGRGDHDGDGPQGQPGATAPSTPSGSTTASSTT
ncbi:MAG: hypothetical protein HOQ27_06260 [Dermatophilaceae bacterium]|nr:hypothetical protein [Dermatophilaceae bacterium]